MVKKREQLYYLIKSYLDGGYDTVTFCDVFHDIFYPDIPKEELSDHELSEFEKIGSVVSRFSQYEEDFINCPNAFYTEEDVRRVTEKTYNNLTK